MPAALLVVLAALAWLLGVPAAAPVDAAPALAVVGEPPPAVQRLVLRLQRPAKWTGPAPRLAVPGRSASVVGAAVLPAALHRLADQVTTPPSPTVPPALPWVLAMLVLLVLGRVRADRSGWAAHGRTPGSHRGRSPPAYALA